MFCQKCGKELNDGSAYCNFCGASLNNAVHLHQTKNIVSANQKEIELNQLQIAKRYLSTVTPYYNKKSDIKFQIGELNRKIARSNGGFIALGVVSAVLAFFSLLGAISGLSSKGMFSSLSNALGAFQLLVFLGLGALSVLSFAMFIPKRKKEAEKMKLEVIELNNQISQIDRDVEQLHKQPAVQQDQSVYISYFPQGDFTLNDVDFIINLMTSGRADSFKEALNRYDEHMHRQRMEQMTQEQVVYTQQAADSAAQTAQTVQEINRKMNY